MRTSQNLLEVLSGLNIVQQKAVKWEGGPLVIIAGAGTGKTKTLTARIIHLLHSKQAQPHEILALTFTNKAAHEMKERVHQSLAPTAALPHIATFHAFARSFLQNEAETPLIEETARLAILTGLKKSMAPKGMSLRDISLEISRAKNRLAAPAEGTIAGLLQQYNLELAARHAQDFDDLLLGLHQALARDSVPKQTFYRYILIDEFQDTNELQYQILKLLDTTGQALVIGDPRQSIYGFRGASANIFDRFEQEWDHAKRIVLDTNYRSAPQIVHLSGHIFPKAPIARAHRTHNGVVRAVEVLNEYSEADWVVNEIERQIGGSDMLRGGTHFHDDSRQSFRSFAVLYRTHAVARVVQRALEKSGIPFQVAGEGSPYLDSTVNAVVQALSYISGRINTLLISGFTPAQTHTLLEPLKPHTSKASLVSLTESIIKALALSFDKNPKLRQFVNSLLPYEQWPLRQYLEHIELLAGQEYYDPGAEAVTLLTIHAAKGLEFSRVFLIATEEGVLPLDRSGYAVDLEEERRLFYVAVTRARDELYLLHARCRQSQPCRISSFITCLPPNAISFEIDPNLSNQQQKARRRAAKRAQSSLF